MSNIIILEQKDLTNGEIQTLRCSNCEDWLKLILGSHVIRVDNTTINVENFPLLECPKCLTRYLPEKSKKAIEYFFVEAKKKNKSTAIIKFNIEKAREKRFDFCKDVDFKYDPIDYEYIPGLWRAWDMGYLTPVFFKKDLLVKYYNHPDYLVEFGSDTYGTVHMRGENIIPFGMNRSQKILMWLGELQDLSREEKLYLASNNIESDHDVASEFYQGQIEVEFTDLPKENKIIEELNKFNKEVFKKYNFKLLHLDNEAIPILEKIKKPIFYNKEEVGQVVDSLFKLLIERINVKAIKKDLKNIEKQELKDLKNIKTFQMWLIKRLGIGNADEIIAPLFILYDLRKIFSHLVSDPESQKLFKNCIKRLSLLDNVSHEEVYKSLLDKLSNFYSEINSFINKSKK
jgi:hypothetical protein